VYIDCNLAATVIFRIVIDNDPLSLAVKTAELLWSKQGLVGKSFRDPNNVKKIVHDYPERKQMLDPCLLICAYSLGIVAVRGWHFI